MLASIRKLLSLLSPRMRLGWFGLIPLSLVEAVLESLGAAAVFALIRIMDSPSSAYSMPVVSMLYSALGIRDATGLILSFTLAAACLFVFKNFFLLGSTYLRSAVTGRTVAALSSGLLLQYLSAPLPFHSRRSSAGLTHKVVRSTEDAVRRVLESAVSCISEILVLAGMAAVLILASPVTTLVSLAAIGLVLGALLYGTHRRFYRLGAEQHQLSVESREALQQALGGIRELKAMDGERHWYDMFLSLQLRLEKTRKWHATLNAAPRFLVETVFVCIPLLVVGMTCAEAGGGQKVLPLLGLFAYAGFRAIPSFNRMAVQWNNIRYGAADAHLVYEDMRLIGTVAVPHGEADRDRPLAFQRRLAVEGVFFAYGPEAEPVLKDLDLIVAKGESVAIVGATGSGKSTLIDIILGLLPPSMGRVTVDDVDISDRAEAWRRKIGYVPQNIYLTHDTLRRNIAFGVPDGSIVDEKVNAALRLAQLEDFVAGLPAGLDTMLGERGVTISGGERQRVAIARAVYRDPELLIFDEATSALDTRTEQAVAQAIGFLHGRTTILLVAHRMQTVQYCDRIVFLRAGRIEISGTWDELMQRSAEFRALAHGA
ncbi:MAG: ABC transporter ATP-binding protein [Acidobacteriota bacterium]